MLNDLNMGIRPFLVICVKLKRLVLIGSFLFPAFASLESAHILKIAGTLAFAQSEIESDVEVEGKSYLDKTERVVDETHATISRRVLSTADWIDRFFDKERAESEENRSHIRLNLTSFWGEYEGLDFKARARLKVVLPRTKRRLRLVVSGDPDNVSDFENAPEQDARERIEGTGERNVDVALWYFIKDTAKRNFSIRPSVRFRSGEPAGRMGVRYRGTRNFEPWTIRFTPEVNWFTDTGFESIGFLDFERQIKKRYLFRTTLEGSWFEEVDGYFYSCRFFFFHPLTQAKALQYEWNNFFVTEPNNRLDALHLRVRYRQRLWREWLFVEMAPELKFERFRDFNANLGFLLRFEIVFGKYHLDAVRKTPVDEETEKEHKEREGF